jgi:ABC-2 type transport system ATP-binding protein
MFTQAIEVQNLSHYYGRVQALEDVSFSVQTGEIFGFLGPNGAGKSTTVRILSGQLRPSSGRAWVAGCDVVEQRDQLKPRIGVVFEHQNLYERLSARANLAFSAGLYGAPRKNIDEVLDLVGLKERADDPLKSYSNGMKQRLLIGRALLHKPLVLFLDEPTRGLDPNMAREIRLLVTALGGQGVTIFLTTHYMEEADRLCSRVAILDHGRIVALDQPELLKAAYPLGERPTLEDVFVHLTGRALADAQA